MSPEELRGMLSIRKAQVEQSLAEERLKLRQIESCIQQIEEQGALRDYDVVLRQVAAAPSPRRSPPKPPFVEQAGLDRS